VSSTAVADSVVDIALVFPELLGTYGDGGNALVLERRLARRGISARIIEVGINDPIPRSADVYLLGGGEDAPQFTALEALRSSGALHDAIAGGAALLAVCAGFQLIGTSLFGADGSVVDGLHLVNAVTTRAPKRLVGEVAVRDDTFGTGWIVGFENHRGVTAIGAGAEPLGSREPAQGCTTDGIVSGRVVGTYLHGPVLARNPRLADQILESVTGPLAPLADVQAELLHRERLADVNGSRTWPRWAPRRPTGRKRQPRP
jgi:lipid II isoglutaminyl synthase (glutamine-hydrolysing)